MTKRLLNIFAILAVLTALLSPTLTARASDTPTPETVGLPGTHQDELGCSGEWQPGCEQTLLVYDPEDGIWQGEFEIQPDNDDDAKGPRYKVALNGGWGENYGVNAARDGADIPLVVTEPTMVKFYYDHETHWIADNFNKPIFVAVGDFQQQLGCINNDDAACLRSWLQDPEGDGVYGFTTRALAAGTYSVSLTQNEDAADVVAKSQQFTVEKDKDEIYIGYDIASQKMTISTTGAPVGNITKLEAQWVSKDTILWVVPAFRHYKYSLFYSPDATLELTPEGIANGTEIPLEFVSEKPDVDLLRKYPYLRDSAVLRVTETDPAKLGEILRGQVAVMAFDASGAPVDAAGLQIPGVLDDLYEYTGPLGVTFDGDIPTLRVWAPTAASVEIHLFDSAKASYANKSPMEFDPATGVWSLTGSADWKDKFYLYAVRVYVPETGAMETNIVTDPYSFSLSTNSQRSQIVDLNDPALAPSGWEAVAKPALAAPEDSVIYELHVRDFSASDQTVPDGYRGTYMAFVIKESNGMKHLAGLAEAGLTHIHLLPVFDIASVNEDKSTWQFVDEAALAAMPPDSDGQVNAVSAINGSDPFNWGYDPLHYTVPDGAYTTDPDGSTRILEFRSMVQALNETGLRVVMDVVYNHTNASGQSANSVLDRVVPGYYHRLSIGGAVEKSTCCQNTASENEMMRKLMVDSVVTWAKAYKVDGFRFDLMGHHMLADMQAVRAALDELTLEKDGVDGKSIYVYGEGWDFGEVANNARGKNASQQNIAGTGIGVFNDRLRDAVRGGNPFDDPRLQGFATGLLLTPNASEGRSLEDQQILLNNYTDWIRLGLAGNLAGYQITRADGTTVPGRLVGYNSAPAGYTADPQENIIYVSAHDNETIFDAVQLKAPAEATLADRIRMNNLALSVVMFSQGVPFFHAGDDLLRSKSLDRNSYNSGDWFNKLDWTYDSNNWGVGLPSEGRDRWDIFRPLLADPGLAPAKSDITFASAVFREYLQIRKSSPLFRLQTGQQVNDMVSFINTGPGLTPGLIIMRLTDTADLDPAYNEILVFFNANPEWEAFGDPSLAGKDYALHPVQQNSADDLVRNAAYNPADGSFNIPPRTTAVFVSGPGAAPAPTETEAPPATEEPPAPDDGPTGAPTAALVTLVIVVIGALIAFFTRKRKTA
ncbi:MAG: pullulanase-type alpha-1,6-glucosidase [Chloroflexota bacterium]